MGELPANVLLDSTQYTTSSIRRYVSVYGEDFVSPGGAGMAMELIGKMNLKPDNRVLDVGCGLGGSAFLMADRFDLLVDGIDLSRNMLEIANQKRDAYGLGQRVSLEYGDCLELDRPGHYDAVYSRDVFLHIRDKARLFSVLKRSLQPGGILLFTDYCCGQQPWHTDFVAYVKDRGYCLSTLPEYVRLVADAGFDHAEAQDISARFIQILQSDLDRIADLDLAETVRADLQRSWQGKLAYCRSGDHRWGLITAISAP